MNAPKYDKSRIMRNAWKMFKNGYKIRRHVCTFGECLKEAWASERKEYDKSYCLYILFKKYDKECEKRDAGRNITESSMDYLSDTLTSYYANNAFNGD